MEDFWAADRLEEHPGGGGGETLSVDKTGVVSSTGGGAHFSGVTPTTGQPHHVLRHKHQLGGTERGSGRHYVKPEGGSRKEEGGEIEGVGVGGGGAGVVSQGGVAPSRPGGSVAEAGVSVSGAPGQPGNAVNEHLTHVTHAAIRATHATHKSKDISQDTPTTPLTEDFQTPRDVKVNPRLDQGAHRGNHDLSEVKKGALLNEEEGCAGVGTANSKGSRCSTREPDPVGSVHHQRGRGATESNSSINPSDKTPEERVQKVGRYPINKRARSAPLKLRGGKREARQLPNQNSVLGGRPYQEHHQGNGNILLPHRENRQVNISSPGGTGEGSEWTADDIEREPFFGGNNGEYEVHTVTNNSDMLPNQKPTESPGVIKAREACELKMRTTPYPTDGKWPIKHSIISL